MKKLIVILLTAIPLLSYANSNALSEKQKIAQQFYTKINVVMGMTDKARDEYNQGNPNMWKAINSDLKKLVSESDTQFGPAFSTPFQGCFKLGKSAENLWTEKMTNSPTLPVAMNEYEIAKKECKQNIVNPQDKNDNVAVIDLSN